MIRFGIAQTAHGFEVAVLQEDGRPCMSVSKPFFTRADAIVEMHRLELGTEVCAWKAQ